MRKLLFLLLLLPLLFVTSCSNTGDSSTNSSTNATAPSSSANQLLMALDREIEASNAQMPMKVDYATNLLSLTRDGDNVTYVYEIDESSFDFEDMIADKESFKNQLKNQISLLSTPDNEVYAFMSLLRDTGKNLRYVYKGNTSGKTMTIEFANSELKELINPKR